MRDLRDEEVTFHWTARRRRKTDTGSYIRRKITCSSEGSAWSADPKHAQVTAEAYGRKPAQRAISPASKHVGKGCAEPLDELTKKQARIFKPAAPTGLYLAADHPTSCSPCRGRCGA